MNASTRRSPYRRHRRDRSTSEERPTTRTYHDHTESDYSDDFEDTTPPSRRKVSKDRHRRHGSDSYYTDQSSTSHLHSSSSKKTTQSVTRGLRGQKKTKQRHGWRSQNSSKPDSVRVHRDNITTRMLSAKQRKINEIQNELNETEQRLDGVLKENKLLKTVQHRQDKALKRFQDVESDLPRLISQNFEDQRVLKTRLKKAQEAEKILEEKLHENNDEMQKMERTLRKLKKVVYDKNLGERSELARQLTNTENNLTVAERKVKELEKKLELTSSSFTRQVKSERQKHKETKEKLDELMDEYQTVQARLKEKERALNVSNIYALRNKEHTMSNHPTPRKHGATSSISTQTDVPLPISFHANDSKNRWKNSEEKQEDEKKPIVFQSDVSSPIHSSPVPASNGITSALHSTTNHVNKEKNVPDHTIFLTSSLQTTSPSPSNSFVADSIEFEKPKTQYDLTHNGSSSLRSNVRNEERDSLQNDLEKQRKLEEERHRLAEEQKKKNALLAKMREIEQNEPVSLNHENAKSPPILNSPLTFETPKNSSISSKVTTYPKSKAELVKSLLGNEDETNPVVENLHMGLPSTAKKAEKFEKELSFGGYAPSVGTTQASRKPTVVSKKIPIPSDSDNDEPMFDLNSGKTNKKSDLLNQLFGEPSSDDAETATKPNKLSKQNGVAGTTPRAKPVHSGYPWEKNVVTTNNVNGHANGPNKVKTGLAVEASPSIHEDDIEELAL